MVRNPPPIEIIRKQLTKLISTLSFKILSANWPSRNVHVQPGQLAAIASYSLIKLQPLASRVKQAKFAID